MDQYYDDTTDDIIAKLWDLNFISPPDSEEIKIRFRNTFGNEIYEMNKLNKDSIGSMMEDYMSFVFEDLGYSYIHHPNGSQNFPDYEIYNNWLEIKTFSDEYAPGFDLLSYTKLVSELPIIPGTLYADYLVLTYHFEGESFYLSSARMYKIWELCKAAYDDDGKKIIAFIQDGNCRPRSDIKSDIKTQSHFNDDIDFVVSMSNNIALSEGREYADRWLDFVRENVLSHRFQQ